MASDNDSRVLTFRTLLLQIARQLEDGEVERLFWITGENYATPENDAKSNAMILFQTLEGSNKIHPDDLSYLKCLLGLIDRMDLAQMIPDAQGANGEEIQMCEFRLLLLQISYQLTEQQVDDLSFLANLPAGQQWSAISVFVHLNRKWAGKQFEVARMLIELLNSITRTDLADGIKHYLSTTENVLDDLAQSLRDRVELEEEPSQSSRASSGSTSRSFSSMGNEITCTICLETLSDPISTPCGHSFCRKCLNDYLESTSNATCPNCRKGLRGSETAQEVPFAFKNVVQKIKETKTEKELKRSMRTPTVMQVCVKNFNGKTVTLKVEPTDTVLTLKEKFLHREGFPVREQTFIFGGKELQNDFTLKYYNITHGCTLHFVLRLLGGINCTQQ